jgi:hypothetical protein
MGTLLGEVIHELLLYTHYNHKIMSPIYSHLLVLQLATLMDVVVRYRHIGAFVAFSFDYWNISVMVGSRGLERNLHKFGIIRHNLTSGHIPGKDIQGGYDWVPPTVSMSLSNNMNTSSCQHTSSTSSYIK